MADNPWAGIQNLGAIDQNLYQQPKKDAVPPSPSTPQQEKKDRQPAAVKPASKPTPVKQPEKVARKERQLNAWITTPQNDTLDRLYFGLRAKGVKIQKGELVGVGIEVLAAILDKYNPKTIDASLLDNFLIHYEKKKQK